MTWLYSVYNLKIITIKIVLYIKEYRFTHFAVIYYIIINTIQSIHTTFIDTILFWFLNFFTCFLLSPSMLKQKKQKPITLRWEAQRRKKTESRTSLMFFCCLMMSLDPATLEKTALASDPQEKIFLKCSVSAEETKTTPNCSSQNPLSLPLLLSLQAITLGRSMINVLDPM